ncbi:hypothetical protein BGZ76_001729 [Entomortierella beljakovae]|nr:hypothetical protein BGZ76_001729 [Entomortierella beljakovae]
MTYLQQQQQQHQHQHHQQLQQLQQQQQQYQLQYQQQQQQPPPLPPQVLASQYQSNNKQQSRQLARSPAVPHKQRYHQEKLDKTHRRLPNNGTPTPQLQPYMTQGDVAHATTRIGTRTPHSSRDQTKEDEPTTVQKSHMERLVKHDQALNSDLNHLRAQNNQDTEKGGRDGSSNEDDDDYEEEEDDDDDEEYDEDDDSVYSDEVIDDSENEDLDSYSEYESDSEHTEVERPQNNPQIIHPNERQNSTAPHRPNINNDSQRSRHEIAQQPVIVSGPKIMNGCNGVLYHSSADNNYDVVNGSGNNKNNINSKERNHIDSSPIHIAHELMPVKQEASSSLTSPPQRVSLGFEPSPLSKEIAGLSLRESKPVAKAHDPDAKARMALHVDEDEEDGEEYDDDYDDEGSEYDEDEDEDEDYSYSEDEGEDEESVSEYQYSGEDGGSKARTLAKTKNSHAGQHPHSGYHYRPRLDANYLQKMAITKQVVRRSSLTALLGVVTQPEVTHKNYTIHSTGSPLGQNHHHHHQRHHNATNRRPMLSGIWTDTDPSKQVLPAQNPVVGDMASKVNRTNDHVRATPESMNVTSEGQQQQQQKLQLRQQQHPTLLAQPAINFVRNEISQEPHRPRRTDSGVEVKLSPRQSRESCSDSSSEEKKLHRFAVAHSIIESGNTLSPKLPPAVESNSTPCTAIGPHPRVRAKSEGDVPGQSTSLNGVTLNNSECSSTVVESSIVPVTRPPLKSSISCHTFPRAAGKRTGQKHVSWHHSLFPVERVLHVKPSVPSISTVSVESASATLSQLPTIPVMTRDKVESFHQSIRSLRTLSRIEIAKMSYKQQGRQELTSTVPISKSPQDSIPWWNPTHWLKGTVHIDKRHWKPDDSRESCAYCFEPFHRLTNPRHHCRKCGDLFCGKCASAEILMDAKNCVYVQQSQLARWSRRVDLQRHNLWIDTLPQLHPVRTAAETALVAGSGVLGVDGHGSVGHAGGNGVNTLGGVSMGHRGSNGSGSGSGRRGSWQMAPGASKKSRLSIFGLFGNGAQGTASGSASSDSSRGSLDITSAENIYANHYSHLQPHAQNAMNVTFSAGRRSSSSSILRNNPSTVSGQLMMTNGSLGSSESGLPALAMSRRMSSGGVGEVCLARICVGCERELLKPVPRCTSVAKYYGSLNSRAGQRPPPHGYSSLGPYMGRQHSGPLHPMDHEVDPNINGNYDYNNNGVRRHSPLRQVNYMTDSVQHEVPPNNESGYYNGGAGVGQGHHHHHNNHGRNSREEPVRPYGETRCQNNILTFQEQQLQYTQQTLGPLPRELC